MAPVSFAAGGSPASLALADLTGRGSLDLVAADRDGNGVSVLLGDGAGSFQPPQYYPTGLGPNAVAVADFAGRGILDLAVANQSDDTVSVLPGLGDGTFGKAATYPVGSHPAAVAVADLAGRGIPDLVVANAGSYPTYDGSLSVLLGNGDGTFQIAGTYGVGRNPSSVAVGDFNGDGRLDVVTADRDSGTVTVLLGQGDGTFQTARSYGLGRHHPGQGPHSLAVGDFTGDGTPDLAVVTDDGVAVLLGDGAGSFQPPTLYQAGVLPSFVVTGDLGGRGILDLAVGSRDVVSILAGRGDGSFQAPTSYPVGAAPVSAAVGDVTGDGLPDLLVGNALSRDVTVLPGVGGGIFQTTPSYTVGSYTRAVVVQDVSGDGLPDLIAAADQGNIAVLTGQGDGTFNPPSLVDAGGSPRAVAVGDVTGDGLPDLVVLNGGGLWQDSTVAVLAGNGDGTFQPAVTYDTGTTSAGELALGDVNGAGALDVVVTTSNGVAVLLGNGDGSFRPAVQDTLPERPASVTVGDFNGDGVPDLVVGNSYTGSISILLGNGDGSFRPAGTYPVANAGPTSVVVTDFDGDGVPDLAVASHSGVAILPGQGDGTFGQPSHYLDGSPFTSVVVGDFDGDGTPDVAALSGSWVRVLLGRGDGSFRVVDPVYSAGPAPDTLAAGAFTGAGPADLAASNADGTIAVLRNQADWPGANPGAARRRIARGRTLREDLPALAEALHPPAAVRPPASGDPAAVLYSRAPDVPPEWLMESADSSVRTTADGVRSPAVLPRAVEWSDDTGTGDAAFVAGSLKNIVEM